MNAARFIRHEYLRLVAIVSIILFAFLPLLSLAFNISAGDLEFVFSDANFYNSLRNTLIYTLASSLITTVLAMLAAYLLNSSSLRHKNLFITVLTLGMLVPTLSIGLGIRVMFGKNGFIELITGTGIDGIGWLGLIIGSVISAFPLSFLIIYDALRYEDKGPYDAATIMGIGRLNTFFRLTLPYLKVALISAFFAAFSWIFSDYGIPMELAGRVNTLPMYLYNEVLSSFQYGRGAIAGIFLLIPAAVSFLFDLVFKDTSTNEKHNRLIKPSKTFNIVCSVLLLLIAIILFLPQLSFILLTFIKSYPNDMSFSFDTFFSLFTDAHGLGVGRYVVNSLSIAVMTGLLGTVFAYWLGYFTARKPGGLAKAVNLLSVSTIAIPGIVLGVGYMFLFRKTNGFFYGTMAILVFVNIFHFLGTPFLLARNCLTKINQDYEVIGDTLGISKAGILKSVLIPNSYSTLIEMFSYFFLNSMITISAVAFLCTYSNQPLAILINSYERSGNYEMQGAISVVILVLNAVCRVLLNFTKDTISSKQKKEGDEYMPLTKYQFELLSFLERHGKDKYSQRFLADTLRISLGTTNKLLKELADLGYVEVSSNSMLAITDDGLKSLEPYRVRKAIILAAGFGSRLAPVTLDTPKPLVKINGVRIIDTLLDALVAKGIDNITIVVGYKKEQFQVLQEKYPMIKFIENSEFNVTNNISSAVRCLDIIDRCYICEADLYISNPELIRKYEYSTNYLGAKVNETDDWCFKKVNGYASDYKLGGTDCYQAYGISFWDEDDCIRLRNDLLKVYNSRGGKEYFWDNIPLKVCRKNYKIGIRSCQKADIIEIDNFQELLAVDPSYKDYPGIDQFV